jgi:hypothetical protein
MDLKGVQPEEVVLQTGKTAVQVEASARAIRGEETEVRDP